MVTERVIHVEPGSELDTILLEAGERPIVLVWRGRRIRIVWDPGDLMANHDVERTLEVPHERIGAGSAELDDDGFIEEFRVQ